MVKVLSVLALLLALLSTALARGAEIDVLIDRPTVPFTDSIRVVFVADGQTGQPDFAPLETDFEVLSTSQSTSVKIVNGRMEQSATWTVDLMPQRVGQLTIPPISFGSVKSPAKTIVVTAQNIRGGATPDGEVFLEIEAEPVSPYVQAQTRLTVRIFRAVAMSQASLTEPNISEGDAVIERLGNDVSYETTRGGARFSVVERRYVIFPQRSGKVVVDPLVFEGRLGRQRSFFDPSSGGRIVRVRSEAMELDVRPVPDSFPGQFWLPAEQLDLIEDWPGRNNQWRAGEPLTRTLTLRGRGLIASQLPEIGMGVPDGLKQYPDQPTLETRVIDDSQIASRRETIALIPTHAGEFTLPAIEIPWWNTQTDQLEYARLPAHTVRVLAAAAGPGSAPVPTPLPDSKLTDATVIDTSVQGTPLPVRADPSYLWQAISAALAMLWLMTLGAWWWSRRSTASLAVDDKAVFNLSDLERACSNNDAPAVSKALLLWAKTRWPGNSINSLGDLAARLDGPLQQELHQLSRVRYSPSAQAWQGAGLWQAFEAQRKRRDKGVSQVAAPQLEPLYRT